MSDVEERHKVPVPWEARVRQLLKGDIDVEEATRLPAAGKTEGYDPEVFRADLKLLSNLNGVYKKTKSWRLIEFGMGILGGPGRILHLGEDYDWETYAAIAENEERLITPMELRSMLEEEELLGIDLDVDIEPLERPEDEDAVGTPLTPPEKAGIKADDMGFTKLTLPKIEPRPQDLPEKMMERYEPGTIEDGEYMISTKTLVLGRSAGYPYRKVCEKLTVEKGGSVALNAKEYCEFVNTKDPMLEVTRECRLQLSMELQTVDEILMRLERSRDPEERTALVLEILEMPVKYHFVKGNRMYSRAYIEVYPDQFQLEEISKFSTKIKCESDCLVCMNFMYTLLKPRPKIIKFS